MGGQYGIVRLGIFGSVARQENTDKSDVDIVVEVKNPSLALMYDLRQDLQESLHCEVGLVRMRDSLRPLLKSNILNEAVFV